MWKSFVNLISGEWILNNADNGGATIALRALICSAFIFVLMIGFINMVDPQTSWIFSFDELKIELKNKFTWYSAIFAAVYAALYGRFASQWTYLANLYNSIKSASLNDNINADRLAEWKAGFIEDAECLHLSHKDNFISIIHTWTNEKLVRDKYIAFTPGGEARFNKLKSSIDKRYREIHKTHNPIHQHNE